MVVIIVRNIFITVAFIKTFVFNFFSVDHLCFKQQLVYFHFQFGYIIRFLKHTNGKRTQVHVSPSLVFAHVGLTAHIYACLYSASAFVSSFFFVVRISNAGCFVGEKIYAHDERLKQAKVEGNRTKKSCGRQRILNVLVLVWHEVRRQIHTQTVRIVSAISLMMSLVTFGGPSPWAYLSAMDVVEVTNHCLSSTYPFGLRVCRYLDRLTNVRQSAALKDKDFSGLVGSSCNSSDLNHRQINPSEPFIWRWFAVKSQETRKPRWKASE